MRVLVLGFFCLYHSLRVDLTYSEALARGVPGCRAGLDRIFHAHHISHAEVPVPHRSKSVNIPIL